MTDGAPGLDAAVQVADSAPAPDAEASVDAACAASGPCTTPDCYLGTYSCAGGVSVCAGTAQQAADGAICAPDGESVCKAGACVPKCDATSCASGCCADLTTCVTLTTAAACATGGKTCQSCPSAYVCAAGACGCPAGAAECSGAGGGCTVVEGTDSRNCGRCNHVCDPQESCSNGICSPTLLCTSDAGPFVPKMFALSDGHAYWAASGLGPSGYPGYQIVTCSVTALNTLQPTAPFSVGTLVDMASDGNDGAFETIVSPITPTCGLFWSTLNTGNGTPTSTWFRNGTCSRMATDATTGRVFYVGGKGPYDIDSLDTTVGSDGGTDAICLPNFGVLPPVGAGGGVLVTALNGETVATANGCSAATSPVSTAASAPTAIGTDGTSVYYADSAGIHLCPLKGCSPGEPPLAVESATVTKIYATSLNLYWAGSNGIVGCARSGCVTPTVLVPGATTGTPFAVDASYAYWVQAAGSGAAMYRVPN